MTSCLKKMTAPTPWQINLTESSPQYVQRAFFETLGERVPDFWVMARANPPPPTHTQTWAIGLKDKKN